MSSKHCFEQSCENEFQYICQCSSPETYLCELHLGKHLKLSNRNHKIDSIFLEPSKGTKDAILDLLSKEKFKQNKLKEKTLHFCNLKGSSFEENLGKLDSDSSEICDLIEKVSQARKISKLEDDPVLKLMTLQPDDAVKSVEKMISDSYGSAKLWLNALKLKIKSILTSQIEDLNSGNQLQTPQDLENKILSILSRNPEVVEQDITFSSHEEQRPDFNLPQSHDHHECLNINHKMTSLYLTEKDNCRTKLVIYDIECKREEEKMLNIPKPINKPIYALLNSELEKSLDAPQLLDQVTCITQLPNGELFCYGQGRSRSGIALIIDWNYSVKIMPSGKPCYFSSGTYFNNNVYYFGKDEHLLGISSKFDLNNKRWINLAPIPRDCLHHSVIFNGNILISGCENRNLLLYSIEIDSFSTLPYEFAEYKRKILINAEKLYLIECDDGLIYESQDEYSWQPISKSIISVAYCNQIYCVYNEEGIYISVSNSPRYYKFDFYQNTMEILSIRRNSYLL